MQFLLLKPADLKLDLTNPRFGLSKADDENQALHILYHTADLKELWNSFSERGYERFEPLVATQENGKTVVLEGNRRLAAVKLLLDRDLLGETISRKIPVLAPDKLDTCREIPVVIIKSRSEADGYIGFKHVNGPTRWSSLAKARFGVKFFESLSGKLSPEARMQSLSNQLGDSRGLIIRLLVAYKIVLQAIKLGIFEKIEVEEDAIEFSHLYTMLNNPESRKFVGLSKAPLHEGLIISDPIPESHHKQLGELMAWLYGKKSVIKSQGVDRPKLQRVLSNADGLKELRITGNLTSAVAIAGIDSEDWLESIAKLLAITQSISTDAPTIVDTLNDEQREQALSLLDRSDKHLKQTRSVL